MATFKLIPNGTLVSDWDASGGGTAAYTDVDEISVPPYAFSNTNAERLYLDLAAPSIPEADIDMSAGITVTIKIVASYTHTSFSTGVTISQAGTAADSSSIANGSDTISVPSGPSYNTYAGTAETTSDGSDVWVYGDLAGLQARLLKYRDARFGELRVAYVYAEVDYTPAAVDNATFFGANF